MGLCEREYMRGRSDVDRIEWSDLSQPSTAIFCVVCLLTSGAWWLASRDPLTNYRYLAKMLETFVYSPTRTGGAAHLTMLTHGFFHWSLGALFWCVAGMWFFGNLMERRLGAWSVPVLFFGASIVAASVHARYPKLDDPGKFEPTFVDAIVGALLPDLLVEWDSALGAASIVLAFATAGVLMDLRLRTRIHGIPVSIIAGIYAFVTFLGIPSFDEPVWTAI